MVYGGKFRKALILDMEDSSKICNEAEAAPQSPGGSNSLASGILNGMPVFCEFPSSETSNCHTYKNHTWQFLANLPTNRKHAGYVTMDDNHLWITGGEVTVGKDTKFWR